MLPHPTSGSRIHTIARGPKTLSVFHRDKYYIFGFKKASEARTIISNIHPEPDFTLVRTHNIDLGPHLKKEGFDVSLEMDIAATLYIPKCKGSVLHPINDGGFHIHSYMEDDFITFPISKNLGIVMPYDLLNENEDEYVYKAFVMDPSFPG